MDYACVYTGQEHERELIIDELLPLILKQLAEGEATALLKAFYARLSQDRLQQIKNQFKGFMRSIGSILSDQAKN